MIEVVSEGSAATDYIEKRAEYERGGINEYWIVDPLSNEATFLALDSVGVYQKAEPDEDGFYPIRCFDGLRFDPKWLLQDPLPNVVTIVRGWGLI